MKLHTFYIKVYEAIYFFSTEVHTSMYCLSNWFKSFLPVHTSMYWDILVCTFLCFLFLHLAGPPESCIFASVLFTHKFKHQQVYFHLPPCTLPFPPGFFAGGSGGGASDAVVTVGTSCWPPPASLVPAPGSAVPISGWASP